MRDYLPLMISLLVINVALFLFANMLMLCSYRNRMKRNYDYLSDFPFEGYLIRSAFGKYAIALLGLSAISMGICFAFPLYIKGTLEFVAGRDVMVTIFGALLSVATVILSLSNAYSMRRHILTFVGFAMVTLTAGVVVGFAFLDYQTVAPHVALTFAIISFAFAVCGALIVLNPRLSNWGKLKKIGEGEAAVYVRPRPFLLPFTEWILLFFAFLLSNLVPLGFFVIGMQG